MGGGEGEFASNVNSGLTMEGMSVQYVRSPQYSIYIWETAIVFFNITFHTDPFDRCLSKQLVVHPRPQEGPALSQLLVVRPTRSCSIITKDLLKILFFILQILKVYFFIYCIIYIGYTIENIFQSFIHSCTE